jgi:selenocysteine-specific elongation factor
MRVVATAGHVDHGKSSLVLALTGTDPDRFPEEKARGLTIDLGFAFTEITPGSLVGFVDVPGHVRFVKNMLAGVGAVDVAMMIVAANEGWMPQTDEHMRILDLLDVVHGLVVVTKADLVDAETLELAQLELADHVAGTALAAWPVVVCDSRSGRGIDDVRAALAAVLASTPAARDLDRPRLWVDRVFAAKGAGTVVTGTLTLGSLRTDEDVLIEPGARRARIRGIESHHEQLSIVGPGSRVALNLAGVDHRDLRRGDAVVRAGQWVTPTTIDVAYTGIPGQTLRRRAQVALHVGSGEHAARCRLLDDDGRFARLRVDTALPLAPGDRVVLRSTGRRATLGGAQVLDVEPARRTSDALARLARPVGERVLDARPWLRVGDLPRLAGVTVADAEALVRDLVARGAAVELGDEIVDADRLADVRAGARTQVTSHYSTHPHDPGVDLAQLASALRVDGARLRAALVDDPELVLDRDVVRSRAHAGRASDDPQARSFLDALEAAPFAPPSAAECDIGPGVARALVREGVAVDLDGVVFATSALDEARRRVARALLERGTLTVSDVRDVLGSTRKYVLPIVNQLDREGVTRRRGDDRVAGPRAASAAED